MRWLTLIVAGMVGAACPAQEEQSLEVERLQEQAADGSRPSDARRADAVRAIELRRELIDRWPSHARRGVWMIDQSGALLASLGTDGADTGVLFEADLFDQRARVERVVREVLGLMDEAPAALRQGATALERSGDSAGATELLALERDARVAFFDARAALLGASLSEGGARVRLATRTIEALGGLELERHVEVARLTTLGLARMMAGQVEDAGLDLGHALNLAWQDRAPRSVWCEAVVGRALCEAVLGEVDAGVGRLDRALEDEPVVEDERADVALGVVVLVVRARLLIEAGRKGEAFDTHMRLLEEGLPGIEPDASRSLVLASMGRAAAGLEDRSGMSAEVLFSLAINDSKLPEHREAAIETLMDVGYREDAGMVAADALWEGAVLLLDGGTVDRVRAVKALTALARRYPEAARAGAALGAALAHGRELESRGASSALYDDALALVSRGVPAVAERSFWLLESAKRRVRAGDVEAALSELEQIEAGDSRFEEATLLYGAAVKSVLDEGWAWLREARDAGDLERVREIAENDLVPLAARAVVFARDHGLSWLSPMRADLADARMEAGQAGARVLYQMLLEDGSRVPGGAVRLRLGLARSLLIAGERERAFAQLRQVTGLFGESVPEAAEGRRWFWQSWTLLLEILEEENAGGSRTGVIQAHIARLETIDPGLGGEAWRGRIEAVREGAR